MIHSPNNQFPRLRILLIAQFCFEDRLHHSWLICCLYSLRSFQEKNSKQQHQSLVDRAIPEQLPESDIDNEG